MRQYPVKKLCRTKRNRTNGYLEQRKVKYTHCEPRKFAMFDATCFEYLIRALPQFQRNTTKICPHVLRFPDLTFSSTRLVELLLWLDKPRLGSGNVMGNSFVLFDVSIVISHGHFHCGNRGCTQNTDCPWVKSHFPVSKWSSGTATNVLHLKEGGAQSSYRPWK